MFDSHLHLDAEAFYPRLDAVAGAAWRAGVRGAVNPAVDLASSRRALSIHRRLPWVLPALGLHPLYLAPWPEPPDDALQALAALGGFVAVGEVGLDFWHDRSDEDRQRAFLASQARLAARLGLPILLHARKGFYEAFSVLRAAGFDGPGVVHAFTGSRDMAALALDRGFFLSASSVLTFPNAGALRDLFRWAPRDRLLVETDAPDLPPWPRRERPHRPEHLPVTVAALAHALGLSPEETAELTEANARRLFRAPAAAAGGAS